MQKRTGSAVGALLMGVMPLSVNAAGAEEASTQAPASEYVVLYEAVADAAEARAAIEAAGGTLVRENAAVGVATVIATTPDFVTAVTEEAAVEGAAHSRSIGSAPEADQPKPEDVERLEEARA